MCTWVCLCVFYVCLNIWSNIYYSGNIWDDFTVGVNNSLGRLSNTQYELNKKLLYSPAINVDQILCCRVLGAALVAHLVKNSEFLK